MNTGESEFPKISGVQFKRGGNAGEVLFINYWESGVFITVLFTLFGAFLGGLFFVLGLFLYNEISAGAGSIAIMIIGIVLFLLVATITLVKTEILIDRRKRLFTTRRKLCGITFPKPKVAIFDDIVRIEAHLGSGRYDLRCLRIFLRSSNYRAVAPFSESNLNTLASFIEAAFKNSESSPVKVSMGPIGNKIDPHLWNNIHLRVVVFSRRDKCLGIEMGVGLFWIIFGGVAKSLHALGGILEVVFNIGLVAISVTFVISGLPTLLRLLREPPNSLKLKDGVFEGAMMEFLGWFFKWTTLMITGFTPVSMAFWCPVLAGILIHTLSGNARGTWFMTAIFASQYIIFTPLGFSGISVSANMPSFILACIAVLVRAIMPPISARYRTYLVARSDGTSGAERQIFYCTKCGRQLRKVKAAGMCARCRSSEAE